MIISRHGTNLALPEPVPWSTNGLLAPARQKQTSSRQSPTGFAPLGLRGRRLHEVAVVQGGQLPGDDVATAPPAPRRRTAARQDPRRRATAAARVAAAPWRVTRFRQCFVAPSGPSVVDAGSLPSPITCCASERWATQPREQWSDWVTNRLARVRRPACRNRGLQAIRRMGWSSPWPQCRSRGLPQGSPSASSASAGHHRPAS